MADLDRVLRALHNADAAGDVEAAKHLAQLARSMNQPQEETSFEDQLAALRPDYSVGEIVSRGVTRGAKQLGSALGDVLPAIVGSGLGFKDYAKRQMDEAAQTQEEIQATNAPQFTSYKQVEGLGSAAMYGLETISEQIPNLLTSLIPGVGIEAIAARTIAADAAKGFAVRAAEKGLVGDAAKAYVAKGVQRLAPQIAAKAQTAQNVGIYLGSYAQSAPEIFQGIYDETGEMAPGASLVFGAAAGALDSVLPAKLARTLTGPVKAGVVEKILEKSGMERGLLRAVTANTLETMGVEGITEGAQEAIGIAAERFINDNPGVFGDKEWNRILESSIRGAIAGGPFGAIEGAGDAAKEGAERKQRYQDIKQQRAVRDRDTSTGKALDEYQAANQAITPQMTLPGIESEQPYISSLLPIEQRYPDRAFKSEVFDKQVITTPGAKPTPAEKKAAEAAQKGLDKRDMAQAGKQTEMFAERASPKDELKLTPFAQKAADRNAKRIAVLAKEEEKALKVAEQAKTKLERESAKRRAAALKSERVRLTKQINVQGELPFGAPRPLPSDVAPAEQGETFDMFGAPLPTPAPTEAIAEPTKRPKKGKTLVASLKPEELPADIPADNEGLRAFARALGFGKNFPPTLNAIKGLNVADPVAQTVLGKLATNTRTVGASENIITYLDRYTPKEAPSAVSKPVATEAKPEASGASPEGSVLPEEPTSKGTAKPDGTGMDDTGVRTSVPDARKVGSGSSLDKFSTEAKADAVSQSGGDKSRTKLIELSIDDFLNLATDAGDGSYTDTKLQKTREYLASGFTSVPQLTVDKNGQVTGHEGRHRALALKEAGYTTMPVLLTSENIRWDRQHDETDTDYVGDDKWPKRLQAQKGARSKKFSIPYPINRDNAWVGTYHTKKPEKVVATPPVKGRVKKPEKVTPEVKASGLRAFEVLVGKHPDALASTAPKADKPAAKVKGRIKKPEKQTYRIIKLTNSTVVGEVQANNERDAKSKATKAGFRPDLHGVFLKESAPTRVPIAEAVPKAAKPVEKKAAPAQAASDVDPRRAAIEKERAQLNTSATTALDSDLITEKTYEAVSAELKKPGADFDYARKLLSGKASPKRAERERGLRFGPKYKGASFDADTRRLVEQGNVNGAINRIMQRSNPAIRAVLRKILALNLGVKVKIGEFDLPGSGAYDAATNTILLDSATGLSDHILLHELVHAAVARALDNPNLKITKDFTKFFADIKERLGDAYGGQDLQEFAAELVGNPEFQALLKTIKAPRSESLLKRFMQAVANFFGFPPNVYKSGLKFIEDVLDISEGVEVLPWDKMFYGPGNFQAVADIGMDMRKLAGNTINETKNNLSDLKGGGLAKAAFGMLSLGNLRTLYGKELPSIKSLIDALELRTGTAEKRIAAANAKVKEFLKIQDKEAAAVSRMDNMAIEARLAEVEPENPNFKTTPANRAEYLRLSGIFNALPTSVQNIYRTVRKDYDDAFAEYKNTILKNVSPSLASKLQTQFTAALSVVGYVPFLRRGDFWVEYTDPNTNERAAAAFESMRERQSFIDTQLKPKGIASNPYKNLESIRFDPAKVPATSFVAKIMKDLQEQGKAKGLSKVAIDAQMDAVYQSYLALMPGEAIVKQFMKSKNVGGMERDIIRGYGDIMVRWARRMAATEYGPQIDLALDEIGTQAKNVNDNTVTAAAENVLAQREFFHNPTFTPLVQAATTFSYFEWIAANVSSALVNLTSLPLLVWPMLSRYGFGKATIAMTTAMREAMGDWSKGKYVKLYETLNDHGQLQHTTSREILDSRRQKTSDYTGLKAKVLDTMSIPFAVTERYNRAVTAIAAYDLARGAGKTEQEAIEIALTTTKDAHTSGMAVTSPRWMQHPIGRVFFTFKTFAWNSAFVTARAFHQATKGESPEVKKAARRQLIGMFGMAAALGGAKGLPFYGAATTLGTMLQAMLGDDDEPFDIHEELREFFGELGYKGAANYFLNLEISNRVGVATDLIFRDDPRGVEENGVVMSAFKNAFGPMGSYLVGAERGFNQMREGQIERGIESIVPSWARNGMKGTRYMMEGALTLKGDPVDTDISAYNSLMQAIGFGPADLSSTYERVSSAKGYEKELNNKRQRLLNLYDMARTSGDMELMQEAKERIREYRLAGIGKEISYKTLEQSYKARRAAEKEMIHGVRFDKKLKRQIEEKFFADDDEE